MTKSNQTYPTDLNDTEWAQIAPLLLEAKVVIEAWRLHYNTQRPHSSLAYQPPAAFAAKYPSNLLRISFQLGIKIEACQTFTSLCANA